MSCPTGCRRLVGKHATRLERCMVGNPFSKPRFLDKGLETSSKDRLLIGGILLGISLFWVVMTVLAMRLVAAIS